MPLLPTNSDAIELAAFREYSQLGNLGRYGAELYAFDYSLLPPEAKWVLQLIVDGAPLPYPKHDGNLFGNRAGDLPGCPIYREFTVPTPDLDHRGRRRLVIRDNGMVFFTACHYDRVSGSIGSPEHSAAIAAIDKQWRHGFYVVTGLAPSLRRRITDGIKRIHNSRLPAVIR